MAMDIPGVGAAKVTPAWQGGGTIQISILDAQYRAASDTLIAAVQEKIDPKQDGRGEGMAFIDHVVTVTTPAVQSISVAAEIDFAAGYSWEDMQENITAAIEGYFDELRRTWADAQGLVVRIARIESAILALEGIVDVSSTTLNGEANNLALEEGSIPELEVVSCG